MQHKFKLWSEKYNRFFEAGEPNEPNIYWGFDDEYNSISFGIDTKTELISGWSDKLKIIQFTGKLDTKGEELYDQDIIRDDEGVLWHITYSDELMAWIAKEVGENWSPEHLAEFINKNNPNEILAVKVGNAIETPSLLERVK